MNWSGLVCQRLPQTTTDYHRLPQTTADYHRLPQTTTDYHRLPQTTTDYHRLPLTDWFYSIEQFTSLESYLRIGLDWMDGWMDPSIPDSTYYKSTASGAKNSFAQFVCSDFFIGIRQLYTCNPEISEISI